MKTQKNKKMQNKTKNPRKKKHTQLKKQKIKERERMKKKQVKTHPIFPNNFSHVVYLFLH